MRLAEELVLLLLNEESGYLEQVSGWNLSCVLAGAVLADLAFESRIDTDLESLTLLDDTPVGGRASRPDLGDDRGRKRAATRPVLGRKGGGHVGRDPRRNA